MILCAGATLAAPAQDDSLAEYRERFKQGMDRYAHGAPAEAIGYWQPIYRELGEQKGYRLAYNLGVAYAELGDATNAAEHLQAFVTEVDARRGRGEALGSIVTKEEADARARLASLEGTKGRIRIDPGSPPTAAQVDAGEPRIAGFVAWVTPGEHSVTFGAGTQQAETKTVDVVAGAVIEVSPSPPGPPGGTPIAGPVATPTAPVPASTAAAVRERPFSPLVIAVGGGVTLAAGIAAVSLEAYAGSLRDRFTTEQAQSPDHSIPSGDRQSFETSRTWAYATVGAASGFAAATAGLTAWYFLVSSRESPVMPAAVPEHRGATVVLESRF
jgi:hypothetical protein